MAESPTPADSVLAQLDCHPRSRAEIIVLSGIPDCEWPAAIRLLISHGHALQTGSKRGTRYQLARSVPVAAVATREREEPHVESAVKANYQEELFAALRMLEV